MRHGSLFSGIGGFDLAAEWMGWENVFHCEWMEFPRKVLEYHFPNADSHTDITKTDFKKYANTIDILTGGFPCQPFSMAGKRKGTDDERYLWHEMLRAIQEIKPKFVIAENVFGITNIDGGLVFEQVCLDLENEGYEVQPFIIPAAAKNAPHRRDRCWFVAFNTKSTRNTEVRGICERSDNEPIGICKENGVASNTNGISNRGMSEQSSAAHKQRRSSKADKKIGSNWEQQPLCNIASEGNVTDTTSVGLCGDSSTEQSQFKTFGTRDRMDTENATDTNLPGCETKRKQSKPTTQDKRIKYCGSRWEQFPTQSPICGGDDGLPTKLDGITFSKWRAESIKGYGNAIVPQVAMELFKQIELWKQYTNNTTI